MQSILPFFLAMVAAVVFLKMLATQLRVAYPIVLVVAGLLISVIPGLPKVTIDPDLIFFIFLPPLLFEAAWTISFKEMIKWWRIIGSYAFLVVFFTALSVAVITHYFIPGFTLALGFLLGGIVSPPDAVSVEAITKFVKIPKSTATILKGESLLNDASSLIIFRFALLTVGTGEFIWGDAALSFTWLMLGGIGVGILLAWLFVTIHKFFPTDAPSDIALTLIEPYCMYWVAEELNSSGVLAVVAGGLFMSRRQLIFLGSASRIRAGSVWESFVFLLNGIVFLLIGLGLPKIVEGLHEEDIPMSTAIGYGLLVTGVLIVVRIISSYIALLATLIFRPQAAPHTTTMKQRLLLPLLLGWTGMRGVVSLAAALTIPALLPSGEPFPFQNLILFITFIVILVTLLLQGLTLPYFIKRGKMFDGYKTENEEASKQALKQALREHIYQFLKTKYETDPHEEKRMVQWVKTWEEKAKSPDETSVTEKTKQILREMLESQRRFLTTLNKDAAMDEELIRAQLYQIDLEEERVKML